MSEYCTRFRFLLTISLFALVGLPGTLFAQGLTGTITGRVTDTQGASIPGVTVELKSPAIQGVQSTTSVDNGGYIFRSLPPGAYTVTFRLQGFATVQLTRNVAPGESLEVSAELRAAAVTESVNVVANPVSFVNTVEGATSVPQSLVERLSTNRDPALAISLAPSVHSTGPDGEFSIAGAMSFENLYLVNGVVAQDNIRGELLTLYIDDAIQETTVMTSGVSAEFGRFSGGIVNVRTRSGGNAFSGSFRTNFTNDNWRAVSPFGETKVNKTVPEYQATFGGPIAPDRLWFFGAFGSIDDEASRETGYTAVPYVRRFKEQRYEAKGTGSLGNGRRLSIDYLGVNTETTNSAYPSSGEIMDLASLTNPKQPQSQIVGNFTSAFGPRFFVEAQVSARMLAFRDRGGFNTDLVAGTPLRDQQTGAYWWAPNFCGVCPEEQRNNTNAFAKGSYFLTTGSSSHNLVFGYDMFNDRMRSDNNQSASDYHVWASASHIEGDTVYPVIVPGGSTYIIHWPLQEQAEHTNFRTHSLFFNDSWAVDQRLTLNLGVRYDKNSGRDSSGALVANDSAISPRLGASFDVLGDGRTNVTASYGQYVTAINNSIAGAASPAGNPSIIAYSYEGAPINFGDGPLVSSDVALDQVFDWFFSQDQSPFFVDIPGVATRINGSLKSPHVKELTFGVSRRFGARGAVRADFVDRNYADFYSQRVDTTTGIVFDEFGQPYDLKLIENSNEYERRYRALNLHAGYNAAGTTFGASYTLSRLWGNLDGENVASGPIPGSVEMYPEYAEKSWNLPEGDLSADQRHRARLWATYLLPWGRSIMDTSIGAVQVIQSGTPYGAVGAAVVIPFVADYGYVFPPIDSTYYFTARDAFRTASSSWTDLSVTINRRLGNGPSLFAQFFIANLFNQSAAFRTTNSEIDQTVVTAFDQTDPTIELFDPFTETPVEGVHWKKGPKFGQPVARGAYTAPRRFEFSVGVKF